MGAVHGVYLKYVALSGLSYLGYSSVMDGVGLLSLVNGQHSAEMSSWRIGKAMFLGYSTILNGSIAILFKSERGMRLIGKDTTTGKIPLWSYVVFAPFHIPTWIYTYAVKKHRNEEAATEVQDGWWIGGRYGRELNKKWAGIVDLTVEFPELCIDQTDAYLSIPAWDGVPAIPSKIEEAANFAVEAHKKGDVLIHCAHGRGRSTTIMVAALVRAGLFQTWEEAFEVGVKPKRPVCKLNKKMRRSLTLWQNEYVLREKAD